MDMNLRQGSHLVPSSVAVSTVQGVRAALRLSTINVVRAQQLTIGVLQGDGARERQHRSSIEVGHSACQASPDASPPITCARAIIGARPYYPPRLQRTRSANASVSPRP